MPSITDEKLEDYLGIWKNLVEREDWKSFDVTLQMDGKLGVGTWYTLAYGEEKRELTWKQFSRVKAWLENLPRS